MHVIAVQPYIKMERQVSSIKQQDVEHERVVTLYSDRVKTEHREFEIDEVHDMSYRTFGDEGGLLYIHTIRGVFSYTVKSSPEQFINAFKKHINKEF